MQVAEPVGPFREGVSWFGCPKCVSGFGFPEGVSGFACPEGVSGFGCPVLSLNILV